MISTIITTEAVVRSRVALGPAAAVRGRAIVRIRGIARICIVLPQGVWERDMMEVALEVDTVRDLEVLTGDEVVRSMGGFSG